MEKLKEKSTILVSQQSLAFERYLLREINWQNRLICILGARGTGKTTTLLQRLKLMALRADEALYISLDDMYFATHSLIETIEAFRQQGGRYLFIDEIHKYPGWAREIKNAYDFYKDLHLILTGSSIIEMLGLEVDLSRRARVYELHGLSFREFLAYDKQITVPVIKIDDALKRHTGIAADLNPIKPIKAFKEYLHFGYYPFFKEDPEGYFIQLSQVVNLVIGYDLSFIQGIDKQQTRKIYQLLGILASQVPFSTTGNVVVFPDSVTCCKSCEKQANVQAQLIVKRIAFILIIIYLLNYLFLPAACRFLFKPDYIFCLCFASFNLDSNFCKRSCCC